MKRALCTVVFFVTMAAGCDGCGPVPAEGEGEGEPGALCTRTDALDDARSCRVDDDCACGAHCALGACAFDCRASSDCSGGDVCDDFGRCAPAAAPRVRFGARTDDLVVRAVPVSLRVAAPDTPFAVTLTPATSGGGPVRLQAGAGSRVWCALDGEPSTSCAFDTVPPEGLVVGVGLTAEGFAAGGDGSVELFDAAGTRQVLRAERVEPRVVAAPSTGAALAGTYGGTAKIGDTSGLVGAVENAPAIESEIRARLFVDGLAGVLEIEDAAQTVFASTIVAAFTIDDAQKVLHVEFPQLRWIEGTDIISARTAVDVPYGATLDVNLDAQLIGHVLGFGTAIAMPLRISLTREGDVDGVAPLPTEDELFENSPSLDPLGVGAQLYAGLAVGDGLLIVDTSNLVGCANRENSVANRGQLLFDMCDELYQPKELSLAGSPQNALPLDEGACANIAADGTVDILCQVLTTRNDENSVESFRLDVCASMAQRTGGTIDDSQRLPDYRLFVGTAMLDTYPVWPGSPAFSFNPEGILHVPPLVVDDDDGCAAVALCTPGLNDVNSPFTTTSMSTTTGDPICGNGVPSTVAPGLEQFPEDLTGFLDRCAADLAEVADVDGSFNVDAILAPRDCLSALRLFATFDRAIASSRRGAGEPGGQAVAHRLLQQVLMTQELEARLAADVFLEAAALAEELPTAAVLDWLDASQAPWPLILDPRVIGAVRVLPPALLREPDPRPFLGLVPDATTPPGPTEGISIQLLEAAAAPIETLTILLDQAWRESNAAGIADLRARFAVMARNAQLAALFADDIHARALTAGELSWEDGWQSARSRHTVALSRFVERLADVDAGKNPLGLEETALPIVFPGEPDNDRDRFLAVSRFLVGTGPADTRALAPVAVVQASLALDDARNQWRERTDLDLNADRRIEDITRRYGELITGYCGAPIDDPDFDIDTFNVLDQPLDTEICFVEPACRTRPDGFREELTAASLGRELCIIAGSKRNLPGATEASAQLAGVLAAVSGHLLDGGGPWSIRIDGFEQPSPNERLVNATINGQAVVIPVDAKGELPARLPAALFAQAAAGFDPDTRPDTPVGIMAGVLDGCSARAAATEALRSSTRPGSCQLADNCPVGDRCVDNVCRPPQPDPLDAVDCYFDGAISEQALAVRQLHVETEIARAELEEFAVRYDIAKQSCIILKAGQDEAQGLLDDHNDVMLGLDIGRAAATALANSADALASCASAEKQLLSAGMNCAANVGKAAALTAAEALQTTMNGLQREHEEAVARIENNTELARCFNDASIELVGARAASLRVTQASQAQASAVINLRGQKSYTAALWVEGNTAVANERRRLARALPTRSALSNAAELFADRFRYAQRLTYLSVRAVEHELQASLSQVRRDVLGATRPQQLEDALRTLATQVNNGTVNGSNPTGLHVVVSLREHLLQLRDRSDNPDGEQTLTAEERFRLLLVDPRFAVYDDAGRYEGQQIPFSLHPLDVLGLGQSQGIPIFAQNDCAERLFAVNAAIVGEDVLDDGATVTRLDLLQRNTFYSQRCVDADDPFQVASVHPAVNLLADYNDLTQQNPSPSSFDELTRGQMQPYVNVDRAEFEAEDYEQGSTTQLAGRGLYADYALFIPGGVISVDGGAGLHLENVDDVLLRIDYVAAAR